MRGPPLKERCFNYHLYNEDHGAEERGLAFMVNTHVNTETRQASVSVDVQQLDRELKATSSVLVHGLEPEKLKHLGLLLIEAANSIKFDVDNSNDRNMEVLKEMFHKAGKP